MNVGGLFSGIGGMDAGLARAGLEHAFLCEIDEWRRGVLRERFAGVPIYDDVRDVQLAGGPNVVGRPGPLAADQPDSRSGARRVDLLCGGFPCQDLSVAGRRAGLTGGERSSLFFEFARVADELVPADGWILIENVPGLLSSQDGRDFALVLATLAELGFHDLAWRVLDSRYFGVPQRRRRVFILGRRASGRGAFEVLLEPEGGGGHPQTGGEAGPGVAYASLSGLGSGGPDDNDGQAGRVIAPALVSRYGKGTNSDATDGMVIAATLKAQRGKGGGGIGPEETLITANMRGRRREDDTNLVAMSIAEDQRTGSVYEMPHTHALAQPGGKPGQGYAAVRIAEGVRRLTPVECERLQGLPDGWTQVPETAPDSRRYAALGDAVTASVAHWIGLRLLSYVRAERAS